MSIAPYNFINVFVIIVITFFCEVKLEIKRSVGTYYTVIANISHYKTVGLDHSNPSMVYLSRQMNGMFEIEEWNTLDMGKTWSSTPVTSESKSLNVRPVVPRGYSGDAPLVLWMSGSYEHYKKYRTGIKLLSFEE